MEDLITVIKGTELKLRLEVDFGNSYTLVGNNIGLTVTAYAKPANKLTITEFIPIDGDDTACFVPIDTGKLDTGILILDIKLDIPDDDFTGIDDGKRTEIYRKKTNIKIIE